MDLVKISQALANLQKNAIGRVVHLVEGRHEDDTGVVGRNEFVNYLGGIGERDRFRKAIEHKGLYDQLGRVVLCASQVRGLQVTRILGTR